MPTKPKQEHLRTVLSIIQQRKESYSPQPGRRLVQFEMCDVVRDSLHDLIAHMIPIGGEYAVMQLIGKFTRALEGALSGRVEPDNGLDLTGYEACLAALVRTANGDSEVTPEDVIKEALGE